MISPSDIIHPEDESARQNMEAILGFSLAVKAFLRIGMEQYFHGINMASKIRLSETQLPDLFSKLPPICQKLCSQSINPEWKFCKYCGTKL